MEKKVMTTRSTKDQVQMEKKEMLHWSKLFLDSAWTRSTPLKFVIEDVTDNRAPRGWKSKAVEAMDLTLAIDEIMTGKDPSDWLAIKLGELGMTRKSIQDTIRVFRDSEKLTPNWMRARTIYNTFLARYQGLYGYQNRLLKK
jgi:hypothetical protein